jgi:6-phospho-3-hexuloisomerase
MTDDPIRPVAAEVAAAVAAIPAAAVETLATRIASSRRVVGYGLGREGLMMRALVMRLMHLGIDAHAAGDPTCPPVESGDLLIVCDGPGHHRLTRAMLEAGNAAGAATIVVTAQSGGPTAAIAGDRVVIPVQTMADDAGSGRVLPMGSLFEIAMLVAFDTVAVRVQALRGVSAEDMRARHTNLE